MPKGVTDPAVWGTPAIFVLPFGVADAFESPLLPPKKGWRARNVDWLVRHPIVFLLGGLVLIVFTFSVAISAIVHVATKHLASPTRIAVELYTFTRGRTAVSLCETAEKLSCQRQEEQASVPSWWL